ncbi:hypothetical protein CIW52_31200 [Mycolicibacterium sp. P9-64]|nr:hypothetical protein CIW52_31200 [Mycolicibacterium sp. P9-64]
MGERRVDGGRSVAGGAAMVADDHDAAVNDLEEIAEFDAHVVEGVDGAPQAAALTGIPYAVARRHLVAGQSTQAVTDAIVEDCARALISDG